MKNTWLSGTIIACAIAFGATPASAEEVTLKPAMFIKSTKSLFREVFDKFVAEVNAKGLVVLAQAHRSDGLPCGRHVPL